MPVGGRREEVRRDCGRKVAFLRTLSFANAFERILAHEEDEQYADDAAQHVEYYMSIPTE